MLIVRRGPSEGTSFVLDSDLVTVGRSDDADVVLDDVTVSRRHAQFIRDAQGWQCRDVGQPERHLRQPGADRRDRAGRRRRGPDRQVPVRVPRGGWPAVSTAAASDGLLSIGEVLHLLRSDFPDISISKIRYLEAEDLVEPQRTPSGYRKFTRADAERLRYVLRMQRDHYLPLKVIREHLDAIDRGLQPAPLSADGHRTAGAGGHRRLSLARGPRRREPGAAPVAQGAARGVRHHQRGPARARVLRPGRPGAGHLVLRRDRPAGGPDRRGDGPVRLRAAAPAPVPAGRRS